MPKKLDTHSSYATKQRSMTTTWLKNATQSLGSNVASVIKDVSPNMYEVSSGVASVMKTIRDTRKPERAIMNAITGNQYVKMGRDALNNAIKDFKSGNFNNEERMLSSLEGDKDDKSNTYFGDFDSDDESGESKNIHVQFNPEELNNINQSINRQTHQQMVAAKANVDAIIATSSASMAMNQKHAEAAIGMLGNINNSLQALVAYNNETMTRYVESSMAYYENMGKIYASEERRTKDRLDGADVLTSSGSLKLSEYKKLMSQNFNDAMKGTFPGEILQAIKTNGKEIASNPLMFLTTAVMTNALPEAMKGAVKSLDTTFGDFVTEMIMKTSNKFMNSQAEGFLGGITRYVGKILNIDVERKDKFEFGGKVTNKPAVYDGIARHTITSEIPKYLRESTAYLRELVMLSGGDPDKAVRGSSIFNRETGSYERFEDFSKSLMQSIEDSIHTTMKISGFGSSLRDAGNFLNSSQRSKYEKLTNKFYSALEKSDLNYIDPSNADSMSDLSNIVDSLDGDESIKSFLKLTLAKSFAPGRGGINLNSARMKARRARNKQIEDLEFENGADLSQFIKNGTTVDEAITAVLYGTDAKVNRQTAVSSQSVVGKLSKIEYLLERGIYVKAVDEFPNTISHNNSTDTQVKETSNNATVKDPKDGKYLEEMTAEEINNGLEKALGGHATDAKGKASRFVQNKTRRLSDAMHYMVAGKPAMAMSEIIGLFGDSLHDTAVKINDTVVNPLKESIFGTKKDNKYDGGFLSSLMNKGMDIKNKAIHTITGKGYITSDGEKIEDDKNSDNTVVGSAKKLFGGIKSDFKEFIFGKGKKEKMDGVLEKGKTIFSEGIDGWKKAIFGEKDPKEEAEKLKKEINERMPDTIKGGVIGAGLGIASGGVLGSLIGGPVSGALLGSAIGFISKSDKFHELVFGKDITDENGNTKHIEGIISAKSQQFLKDNKSKLVGGATVGAGVGALTGGGLLGSLVGGPVAGALLGLGATIVGNSDSFKELVFGKEVTDENGRKKRIGGIMNSFKDTFGKRSHKSNRNDPGAKAVGMSAIGTGSGLLLSMFTPIGPLGGALMGFGASILAEKDNFHKWLFGDEEEKKKGENSGLLARIGASISANVLKPIGNKTMEALEDAKDAAIEKLVQPIANLAGPIGGMAARIYDKVSDKISGAVDHIKDGFVSFTKNIASGIGRLSGSIMKRIFNNFIAKRVKNTAKNLGEFGKGAINLVRNRMVKRNQRASLKRFQDEDFQKTQTYQDLMGQWSNEYNNLSDEDKALFKSEKDFIKEKQKNYFYSSRDMRGDFAEQNAERKSLKQQQRELKRRQSDQERLITTITGGRLSEVNEKNIAEALKMYKDSKQYAKGKGLAGFKQNEILELLAPSPYATKSNVENTQEALKNAQENLQVNKDQLNILEKILLAISPGTQSGIHDEKRQERREVRDAKKLSRDMDRTRKSELSMTDNAVIRDRVESAMYYVKDDGYIQGKKILKKGLNHISKDVRRMANYYYKQFLNYEESKNYDKAAEVAQKFQEYCDERKEDIKYEKDHKANLRSAKNMKGAVKKAERDLKKETGGRGYALGGQTREGDAVVGENGPEIVRFNAGDRVLSNDSMINVRIAEVSPESASTILNAGPVDTIIKGTEGLIPTYTAGTTYDENTDNAAAVKQAIDNPKKNVSTENIKADMGDNKHDDDDDDTSLWEDIKSLFSSSGGIGGLLKSIGTIGAAAAGLTWLLKSDSGKALVSNVGNAVVETGEQIAYVKDHNAYDGGVKSSENTKNVIDQLLHPIDNLTGDNNLSESSRRLTRNRLYNKVLKPLEKSAKEASENFAAKSAKIATKATKSTDGKSLLSKVKPFMKKAVDMISKALQKKAGKASSKIGKTLLTKVDDIFVGISKALDGKLRSWIIKKLTSLLAKLGISAGVVATGVGALGLLAKDAVWITIGAINGFGKAGVARLFNCETSVVDGKMRVIASAIGGLKESTPGAVVDVLNEIWCAISGHDLIAQLAETIYASWAGEEAANALNQSQANVQKEWEEYQNNFLESEWKDYLEDNDLTEADMPLETYKQKVANGDLESDVLGLESYIDKENKSFLQKAGSAAWTVVKYSTGIANIEKGINTIKDWSNKNKESGEGGGYGSAVPFYSQKDPRWRNMEYEKGGRGETMADAGCGPTAFAMAASGATGRAISPVESASMMKKVGARDNTGTNWKGMTKAANAYGISTNMQRNPSTGFVDAQLNAGHPVVLSGRTGGYGSTPYTPQGHYVVATGKDEYGNYIINDPNRMNGPTVYNKSDIMKETGAAWGFGGRGDGLRRNTVAINDGASATTSKKTGTGTGVKVADVLKVALNEVGYNEKNSADQLDDKTANAGKKNYTKYARDLGHGNGQSWCCTFVTWCFFIAANQNKDTMKKLLCGVDTASCETLRKACINAGRYGRDPQPGDLIFFRRNNPNTANHIGIVTKVDGTMVYTVEGNTSSKKGVDGNGGIVAEKSYSRKDECTSNSPIMGYGRPLYDNVSNFSGVLSADPSSGESVGGSTTDATSSNKGNLFSNLLSFIGEMGTRAVNGLISGNWDSDYSGFLSNLGVRGSTSSTSMPVSTGTASNTTISKVNIDPNETAKTGWNFFKQKGMPAKGIAGLFGNIHAESGFRSNNLQNTYEKKLGSDAQYTAAVDNGTYTNFANDSAGYGLAQWTFSGRKQGLYDYIKSKGASIASDISQYEYLWKELNQSYPGVLSGLMNATDIPTASSLVLTKFERPADQSQAVHNTRASFAQAYYDKFNNNSTGGGFGGSEMDELMVSMNEASRIKDELDESNSYYERGGKGVTISRTGMQNTNTSNDGFRNNNTVDLSEVLNYMKQMVTILGESSTKLNMLQKLDSVSGGNVTANILAPQSNNSQNNSQPVSYPKTTSSKFATHQGIAAGGL